MGDAVRTESSIGRLNPLDDAVFACLFDDIERTGNSMREFLSAVLTSEGEEPIAQIVEMGSESPLTPDWEEGLARGLSERAENEPGAVFAVQVRDAGEGSGGRSHVIGSCTIARKPALGCSFPRTFKLMLFDICDLRVREGSGEVVEPVGLLYGKGPYEVASDAFEIYHIQLPAFRKACSSLDQVGDNLLYAWLYFFDRGYESEEEARMLALRSEGMRDMVARYDVLEKARGMRGTGMSDEDIAAATGLTRGQVAAL